MSTASGADHAHDAATASLSLRPPLVRPRKTLVGGVSVALANHLGWPVSRIRWLFALTSLIGGAGALLYLWLWALTPSEGSGTRRTGAERSSGAALSADDDDAPQRRAPIAAVLLVLGSIASVVAVIQSAVGASTVTAIVLAIVLTGSAVGFSLAFDEADASRSRRYVVTVRALGVAVFLMAGLLLLSSNGGRPDAMTAVLAVVMLVLGLGVAVAPLLVKLWTDLLAERAGRVREEQRAEIAAHLHDSVLQTLALIQNRAGASSDIARLARAQERELREWLFAGTEPISADLAQELRDIAAAIELDHPARIDVVAVGESMTASAVIVAAAREAMLNAARHAGGDVSVYIEGSASAVDVFVRDRGPGIDLDALPADRFGVRESIVGRMQRAGGSATVQPGAGGSGTEVHLHLPWQAVHHE
ncbi:ATP-binding protein [Homoserinimonas hongtaonis]|uniref:ATP-binding protein n=1 Tax=Homoserinimonas hongtaonis TaxID=2079791 RepID=UPI001F542D9C|nr:ATP-binding protein [Salinibacterium hongtaonis]